MPHPLWDRRRYYRNIAMPITDVGETSFSLSDNKAARLKRFVTFFPSKSAEGLARKVTRC